MQAVLRRARASAPALVVLVAFSAIAALGGCASGADWAADGAPPAPRVAESAPGSPARQATPSAAAPSASGVAATPTPTAGPATPVAAPRCRPGAEVTSSQAEGPFYKRGSPERTSLVEPGMPGTRVVITGYVLTPDCRPIARAWLDFWQTDEAGAYDNAGFRLRGHHYTDPEGRYRLETIAPGQYPGRTPHIHVKVQAPGGPVLTTQLYFPGVPRNEGDAIYRPELLLREVQSGATGITARFDFVVRGP